MRMWWNTPIRKSRKKTITPTNYLAYQTVPHPTYLIVFFRSPSWSSVWHHYLVGWWCSLVHVSMVLVLDPIWVTWCPLCFNFGVTNNKSLNNGAVAYRYIHIQISNFWWLQDSCIFLVCHFYVGINESSMTSVFRFLVAWDSVFCSQEV